MLKNINKLLTGDILKVLCDMGHGDTLAIVDANFPGEAVASHTAYGKLIRLSDTDVNTFVRAIADLFPLDVVYAEHPACVLDLTDGDKAKGMPTPEVWTDVAKTLSAQYPTLTLGKVERFDFYEKARNAYVVIQTGEERLYGDFLFIKGCI